MNIKNLRTTIKLFILVAIICFFFPFVMVSCSGESVEATGFELATNISMHEEIEFDEEDKPNPYLIAGFACGLLGLGVAWGIKERDKKALISGGLALTGAAFLLLFRSTFWDFYEMTGYEDRVTVEFRWGWVLSVVAYIGSAGLSFLSYWGNVSDDRVQPISGQDSESAIDRHEHNGVELDLPSERVETNVPLISVNTQELGSGATYLQSDKDSPKQLPVDICIPEVVIRSRFKTGEIQEWKPREFPCFIGRDSSVVQITVSDSCASRIHARLYIESGALMIADEGSSNGTIVNGDKITTPAELLSGDQVTIGESVLCFEVSEG